MRGEKHVSKVDRDAPMGNDHVCSRFCEFDVRFTNQMSPQLRSNSLNISAPQKFVSMFHHNNLLRPRRICLRSIDRVLTLFLFVVLLIPAGCSKEEIKEKLKEAQQKVESVAESTVKAVEDKLPPTGSIALELSKPVEELKRADFELIVIGDGRPNVLQILTYDPASSTRPYPCMLLHGTTSATSAAGLSSETVACDMYFQSSPTDPVVMTKPGSSVPVTFRTPSVEDNTLSATLGAAELVSSDNSSISIRGGELVAVIREGN